MENKLRSNIFFSFVEKTIIIICQFLVSILLSKFLPREDFGVMAIVAGAFAFLQFLNISLENSLIKNFKNFESNIDNIFIQFIKFNYIKIFVIAACSSIIALFYFFQTKNYSFIIAVSSTLLVWMMDIYVSPFMVYSSLVFKQSLITKISTVRWVLNLFLLLGLIYFPSLKLILIKDFIMILIIGSLWYKLSKKKLGLNIKNQKIDFKFIKENIIGYSVWVHLIGVAANIIYRADAFILFYFVGLKTIGNYNVALTVAGIANIIPAILVNQNNVALTHCESDAEAKKMTGKFMRFSLYIGILALITFLLLGKTYLRMVAPKDIEEIYFYLVFIVAGLLIVKMIVSPLISFINLKGSVQQLFLRVQLPILIISLSNYIIFTNWLGANGAAISNLINGIFWLLLICFEIRRYKFKISDIGSMSDDFNQVKKYVKAVVTKV